jgi:hypothetical protein
MRRRHILFTGLLLLVTISLACLILAEREPVYLGHPISYWVEPWHHHGAEPPEREAAAFAAMDERAVRWLGRQLLWQPSKLKEGLARQLNRLGDFTSDRDDDNGRRSAALRALIRLGPRAKGAIPELEALSQINVELHRDEMRDTATALLVRLRGEPLQPYIDRLPTASGEQWGRLATILGIQETNAAEAVPKLVEGLMQTNRMVWVQPTVIALGCIHSHPELSVPAIMHQLGTTNPVAPYFVFSALANFGPQAKDVWPALAERLPATTNFYARQALLRALRTIDPIRYASTNFESDR